VPHSFALVVTGVAAAGRGRLSAAACASRHVTEFVDH
jgi:hypothetical protein